MTRFGRVVLSVYTVFTVTLGLVLVVHGSTFDASWEYACRPEHPDCHVAWEALREQVLRRQEIAPWVTEYNGQYCIRSIFAEEDPRWIQFMETTTKCELLERPVPDTGSVGWEGILCTWLKIELSIETEVQRGSLVGKVTHRLNGVLGPTPEYFFVANTHYTGKLDTNANSTSYPLTDGQYSFNILSKSKYDQIGPCIFDDSMDPDIPSGVVAICGKILVVLFCALFASSVSV